MKDKIPMQTRKAVMLLHAAVVSSWSLNAYAGKLRAAGFQVHNLPYPCRKLNICDSAEYVLPYFKAIAAGSDVIHLAGHSMGGLVCRRLLHLYQPPNLGRMITMGSPHYGTPVADKLKNWKLFKKIFGPAGQDFVSGKPIDWLAAWPPPCDIGVIAGSISVGPGMFILKNIKSDGTVPAYSSCPEGAGGYAEVSASHISIPLVKSCAALSINFFNHGKFV